MMNAPHDPDAARWAALRERQDADFFYSVATTGVYCRPSCAARPARPEHVAFHATTADAERQGFRACKRCKPNEPPRAERQAAQVAAWCRFIEEREEAPTLEQLAEHAGVSPFHLQRQFKAVTGVTPKAYAAAHRADRVRGSLQQPGSVTQAIYAAGYQSAGRFYEQSNALLGMTPSRYRAGGAQLTIEHAVTTCSLGALLVAATPRGVCAILLGSDPNALVLDLARRFPRATLRPGHGPFQQIVEQVVQLVERPHLGITLPLDIQGTAFQRRVWQALVAIPAGTTATYTDIAKALGTPSAVRAVAGACAANGLAVAIPCHRVVRQDGGLAGYRWGVERKRALLDRESS